MKFSQTALELLVFPILFGSDQPNGDAPKSTYVISFNIKYLFYVSVYYRKYK